MRVKSAQNQFNKKRRKGMVFEKLVLFGQRRRPVVGADGRARGI
jgi:hypothetical protein